MVLGFLIGGILSIAFWVIVFMILWSIKKFIDRQK
jgi:hypothetical protein